MHISNVYTPFSYRCHACYVASETYFLFSSDQTFSKVFEFVSLSNRNHSAFLFSHALKNVSYFMSIASKIYWFGISSLSVKRKVYAWVG